MRYSPRLFHHDLEITIPTEPPIRLHARPTVKPTVLPLRMPTSKHTEKQSRSPHTNEASSPQGMPSSSPTTPPPASARSRTSQRCLYSARRYFVIAEVTRYGRPTSSLKDYELFRQQGAGYGGRYCCRGCRILFSAISGRESALDVVANGMRMSRESALDVVANGTRMSRALPFCAPVDGATTAISVPPITLDNY